MRQLIRVLSWAGCLLWSAVGCATQPTATWPDYQAFGDGFIDDSGRVIDWSEQSRTVSEGQAYAMFFALVANDRARFDKILAWTEQNLAQGDLSKHLPAWLWGQITPERWGIKDANSASDADLWLAYSLLEASALWKEPRYRLIARALLLQIKQQALHQVENGPLLLLPGRDGFVKEGRIRLNPSYYVPAQLLRFQQEDPQGPWLRLLRDYAQWLPKLAPLGRVPDWAQWENGRVSQDPETMGVGSYDAIRVYLWSGLGPVTPITAPMVETLKPFQSMLRELGHVPEKWSVGNSGITGVAPPGFGGALLPFYVVLKNEPAAKKQRESLQLLSENNLYGRPARYYDQVLILFGTGQADGRFRFDTNGRLVLPWKRQ